MKTKLVLFFAFIVGVAGTWLIHAKAPVHEQTALTGVSVTALLAGDGNEHTESR